MDGDQLRTVREGRLHLNVLDHLRDAVHHLGPREQMPARVHDVADRLTGARLLEDVHRQQRHRLGVVQKQPRVAAPLRHVGSHMDKQPLLLMGSQMHDDSFLLFGSCVRPDMPRTRTTLPWTATGALRASAGQERRNGQTAAGPHHLMNPQGTRFHPPGRRKRQGSLLLQALALPVDQPGPDRVTTLLGQPLAEGPSRTPDGVTTGASASLDGAPPRTGPGDVMADPPGPVAYGTGSALPHCCPAHHPGGSSARRRARPLRRARTPEAAPDPLASAVLTAAAPDRMSTYDR